MTDQCRICCRPVASPFRVYDPAGRIISGCVGKDHDGHLTPLSESLRWHNRKEAKHLRSQDKTLTLAQCEARVVGTSPRGKSSRILASLSR